MLIHFYVLFTSSNYDPIKTYIKIDDQMPVLMHNIQAVLNNKALKQHVKGQSWEGKIKGPVMVAMGHGLSEGYGLGPELPGCMGCCCWFICCCSAPRGHFVNKMKSDFNYTVKPQLGKGIDK
jgi:hypothetical protein